MNTNDKNFHHKTSESSQDLLKTFDSTFTAERPHRTCLAVPASQPKMLVKAQTLPADYIFLDLEDAVAQNAKNQARLNIVNAFKECTYSDKVVALRINNVESPNCLRDILDIIPHVGEHIDYIIIPKVTKPDHVIFIDTLLRKVEQENNLSKKIGLEIQIEDAQGLKNIYPICESSKRIKSLIFGPGDMSANLGMSGISQGSRSSLYPGDIWHYVMSTILVAARAHGYLAIDGPFADIPDLNGLRTAATTTKELGYDGKWVLHPTQIEIVNDVFTPSQEELDLAFNLLIAYENATKVLSTGAVMYENIMIDEASAKMAARIVQRGRSAGLTVTKKVM